MTWIDLRLSDRQLQSSEIWQYLTQGASQQCLHKTLKLVYRWHKRNNLQVVF
jgi:hypothetical protein